MKKFLLFFSLIVFATSSVLAQTKAKPKTSSQELDPFSIIISAGSNWSIFSNPSAAGSTFTQAKQVSGLNFGLAGNWPLVKNLSFQAGLRVSKKGSEVYADTPYYHIKSTSRPIYLQLPVGLEYTYKLKKDFKLFADFGGYVAKGVGGKTSYSGTSGQLGDEGTIGGNDKIIWGNPNSSGVQPKTFVNMKKFDYGVYGTIGLQYWKIRLAVGYDMGLASIAYSTTSPNTQSKNKSLSFTVGVQF